MGDDGSSVVVEDESLDDGGVIRVLRMRRPESRNAMNTGMLVGLVDGLDTASREADVRGVLLTGTDGVFSAGADIVEEFDDAGGRRAELFNIFYESLSVYAKPTAAAVEGPAVGGGAEAAAACDLRTVGRSALFRFPGASYGIPVGAARTIGLVGLGTAKDWVLSCRDVPAEEAHRTGFAQRLVDDGAAYGAALDWLTLVASRHTATVARLKNALNVFAGVPDRVAWENDVLRAHQEGAGQPPRSAPSAAFGMPEAAQEV